MRWLLASLAVSGLLWGVHGDGDDDDSIDQVAQAMMQRGGPPVVALPPMLGPFMLGGPVAIHIGPEMMGMPMDSGTGSLIDMLDMGPFSQLAGLPLHDLPGGFVEGSLIEGANVDKGPSTIFDLLDHHIRQATQASKLGGDFEVKREGDRMQLVAMLPDYKESPPSVEVVGNSLIVRGQKTSGSVVHSFQRSFKLPRGADTDAIHIEYSKSDGKLSIEVPVNAKADTNRDSGAMTLASMEDVGGGSQMTIMLSSGGEPPRMSSIDPFLDLLLGHAPFGSHGGQGAGLLEQLRHGTDGQRKPPALAVQPKNARPFWRLVNDGHFDANGLATDPAIEIVAPRGVELGKVDNGRVATYNSSADAGLRGHHAPMGLLELPVIVGDKDCRWASEHDSLSPWLPMWMLGGTSAVVGALARYVLAQQRSTGKMSRGVELRLTKVIAGVFGCCVLLGLAVSVYLLHRHHSQALEERVLQCHLDPAAVKKLGVRVKGEL